MKEQTMLFWLMHPSGIKHSQLANLSESFKLHSSFIFGFGYFYKGSI